ncbi:MAG TPA: cytochrome C [Myxococcota bacterium]|jgi:hypothetical protein|nr:cytochrome C [Myxococcota bacterium]
MSVTTQDIIELNKSLPVNPEEVKASAGKRRTRSLAAEELPDKVHTWPYLVRNEFISGIILMILLVVWSITIDAPLEEMANPTKTPNPSKAPWYFLGLQEMLVYFDPWLAGVVMPSLIIVGLMTIPYIDINPKGNGYYTFKERPFAILTFNFGFLILWLFLIVVGVFLRGPGWNFFAPWLYWDPHKVVALTNVDLGYMVEDKLGLPKTSLMDFVIGAGAIGAYFTLAGAYWMRRRKSETLRKLGFIRYNIVASLFLMMMGLPVKMLLRWTLNIKYVWVTPWFNI